MTTIHVTRTIKAPIDVVFDAYTDHQEAFGRVPGILSAKVVKPGKTEFNGLGAIREINGGVAWFREEITAFDRPHRMDYQILKSIPPIRHDLGRVEFIATPEGTVVNWTSVFHFAVPLVGGVLGRIAAASFRWVLKSLDDRIQEAAASEAG